MRIHQPIIFILVCYFFITIPEISGQNYWHRTYTENDGLPNSVVFDVTQDTTGKMWFATRSGISEYDGTHWITHWGAEKRPHTSFKKITTDSHGIIWALPTYSSLKLSYYQNNSWQSLDSPPDLHIYPEWTCLNVTYLNGSRWILVGSTSTGLFVHNNNQWQHFTIQNGLPSDIINGIIAWRDEFWIATNRGIVVLKDGIIRSDLAPSHNFPSSKIIGIGLENQEKIWLTGNNWIGYIKEGKFHLFPRKFEIIFDERYHYFLLLPDEHGGIFFANPYLLYHYNPECGDFRTIGIKNGLSSDGASGMLLDREKNLWFTSTRGINIVPSMRFATYNKKNNFLDDEVTAIAEIEPDFLVFGHNIGITLMRGNKETKKILLQSNSQENWSMTRVLDVAVDAHKNVWVAASGKGLYQINPYTLDTLQYRGVSTAHYHSNSVEIDNNGTIWATFQGKLHKKVGNSFRTVPIPGLIQGVIRKIISGRLNRLYILTYTEGLYVLDQHQTWKNYRSDAGRPSNNSYSIYEDSEGVIWVGTLDGLFQIKDNKLQRARLHGRSIIRPVYLMFEDNEKNLWIGTDNGVSRWDGKNFYDFSSKQGLLGKETNRAAGIIDYRGRIWIGTDQGANCYDKHFDFIEQYKVQPNIYLEFVTVNDDTMRNIAPLEFSYGKNNLKFHFNCISFLDEHSIVCRTWLEGYEKDWLPPYKKVFNQSQYFNLGSGSYRFHLQAQNIYGTWSKVKTSAPIVIRKPVWEQWWFYLLVFLGIVGFSFYGVRFILIQRDRTKLEKLVHQRTAQLEESERHLQNQNRILVTLSKSPALATGELWEMLKEISEATSITLNVPRISIWIFNDEHQSIRRVLLYKDSEYESNEDQEIETKYYPEFFKALDSERTLAIDNVQNDERTSEIMRIYLSPRNIQALLSSQVWVRGREVGIISMEEIRGERHWKPEEMVFASSMADFVALAVESSERRQFEEKIQNSLYEKEVLLKEIHHRVKNNLQIISSLLTLQLKHIKDEHDREFIRESQNRVKSMALIHESLYQSNDLTQIEFGNYTRYLIKQLFSSYVINPGIISWKVNIKDIFLDINTAIPCGLIINELITNSIKHAFPDGRKGEIKVQFTLRNKTNYKLTVSDNGIGLPQGFDYRKNRTLGLQLVNALIDQISGTISTTNSNGTSVVIEFQKN